MTTRATSAMAAALALGGALALGHGPAAAQGAGFFGPGPDGDHQPPAYDRDRTTAGRSARQGRAEGERAAGGGLYAGPLYDREPYGFRYGGAGADEVRPGGARFERGYRAGREDERYLQRARAAHNAALRGSAASPPRGAGMGRAEPDVPDPVVLLVERAQQQRAMQAVQRSLAQARAAVEQNDKERAEAALAAADRTLAMAGPGAGGDRLAAALMNQAERALELGDERTAQRALQQVRQAVRDTGGGRPETQEQPAASGAGDGGGGGSTPQRAGAQPQGGAGGGAAR